MRLASIVTFGDSITDGARIDARHEQSLARCAGETAARSPAPMKMGVLNAGIGGNRVLSDGTYGSGINALARFEIDALSQPGVTHVIVMEGINDIGNARQNPTPTAEDLIAAPQAVDRRAPTRKA